METKIFEIASRISTPLALAGFFAAILFFFLRSIFKARLLAKVDPRHSSKIITKVITLLFWLSLVAMILGFLGFVWPSSHSTTPLVPAGSPKNETTPGITVSSWLPPELPFDCTNVYVSFGGQRMTVPIYHAQAIAHGETGMRFRDWNEVPAELKPKFERISGFSRSGTNFYLKFNHAEMTVADQTIVYPILPYVKGNRLYVSVNIPLKNERRIISMNNELDTQIPQSWDRNYSSNAFEVVREDGLPILQVFYRRSNEIQVNGVFIVNTNSIYESFGAIPMLHYFTYKFFDLQTTQEIQVTNVAVSWDTNAVFKITFPDQKAIFKYPAWKHSGEYAE